LKDHLPNRAGLTPLVLVFLTYCMKAAIVGGNGAGFRPDARRAARCNAFLAPLPAQPSPAREDKGS
jgi:hypothetical protein